MHVLLISLFLACFPEIKSSEEQRFQKNPNEDFDGDGFTENEGDCDDQNTSVKPNEEEVCDGFDNDCNGVVDDNPIDIEIYYKDEDGDGFGIEGDSILSCPADKPIFNISGDTPLKLKNSAVEFSSLFPLLLFTL